METRLSFTSLLRQFTRVFMTLKSEGQNLMPHIRLLLGHVYHILNLDHLHWYPLWCSSLGSWCMVHCRCMCVMLCYTEKYHFRFQAMCHITLHRVMSCLAAQGLATSSHVSPCHAIMSCHVILRHITAHYPVPHCLRRNLYSNQWSGSIPDSIGALQNLQYLWVTCEWFVICLGSHVMRSTFLFSASCSIPCNTDCTPFLDSTFIMLLLPCYVPIRSMYNSAASGICQLHPFLLSSPHPLPPRHILSATPSAIPTWRALCLRRSVTSPL